MIITKFTSSEGIRFHIESPRSFREIAALGGDNIKPDLTLWTNANKRKYGKKASNVKEDPTVRAKVSRDQRHCYKQPDLKEFEY